MSLAEYRRSTHRVRPTKQASAIWGLNDPAKYHQLHKPLNQVNARSPLGELFANGSAGKPNEPIVERKAREVITGVYSFMPEMRRFLEGCVRDWNRVAVPQFDANREFTLNGVHATFDKLLCPAGYLQSPMSAKVVDNTLFRESIGLRDRYSAQEMKIARAVWREVFARAMPSSVNVPKRSAAGMPRFSFDAQWKMDAAAWKTQTPTYSRFLTMVEKKDAYGLRNEMEIVFGLNVQKRIQLDAKEKVREANDIEYALSGGAKGKRLPIDKTVIMADGTEWVGWSALRVRNIDAGPWMVNCDLQMIATSHMRAMFARWPNVFHINTDADICRVINGKWIYCGDVSEYDQSMPKDALEAMYLEMLEVYPQGIVDSVRRLYEAPYFTRPLSLEGGKGMWIHTPMDWNFRMNSGNRSGHAFTSLVAKVNKVIETLFVLSHIYPVTPENLDRWLLGMMPMGFVNNGDDEIVWALQARDMARFKELRADLNVGQYAVKPEEGMGFSGRLILLVDPSTRTYKTVPRLHTPFEKMYVPERSIGGTFREYWPIGWQERIDQLHETDLGRELWQIHNFHFAKHLQKLGDGTGWAERLRAARAHLDIEMSGFSAIDREVLADRDKLFYKFTDDDVSADVVARLTSRIPKEYVGGFLRRWYSGTLM